MSERELLPRTLPCSALPHLEAGAGGHRSHPEAIRRLEGDDVAVRDARTAGTAQLVQDEPFMRADGVMTAHVRRPRTVARAEIMPGFVTEDFEGDRVADRKSVV